MHLTQCSQQEIRWSTHDTQHTVAGKPSFSKLFHTGCASSHRPRTVIVQTTTTAAAGSPFTTCHSTADTMITEHAENTHTQLVNKHASLYHHHTHTGSSIRRAPKDAVSDAVTDLEVCGCSGGRREMGATNLRASAAHGWLYGRALTGPQGRRTGKRGWEGRDVDGRDEHKDGVLSLLVVGRSVRGRRS